MTGQESSPGTDPAGAADGLAQAWSGWLGPRGEAWIDAAQRSVLFLDVLRRRGDEHLEPMAKPVPHVLSFESELVVDGRKLARPVNYGLVAIVPPEGVTIDPRRRPFVVVDPRAGHGLGVGGFEADSEIGVALAAGHPCYFVGFTPEPMPGQTIPDVLDACALFLERVIERRPEAEGLPCVIGNCRAGGTMVTVAALRPELFGPLILAGSPLSYRAGVHGVNPTRYSGGLLGGSWLAELSRDLGAGRFDGRETTLPPCPGRGPEQAARIARRIEEPRGRIATQVDREPERKGAGLGLVRRVARAVGEPQGERAERLARIETSFGAAGAAAPPVRRAQGGKR